MFEITWSMNAISALLKVIMIDLVLSGDNAIIIAMATRKLPEDKRNQAIYWGTFFAIILRVLFATAIVFLLKVSWVSFIGGLLLLYIAYKVLVEDEDEGKKLDAKGSILGAVYTIIMADAVMSIDNVMAVAAASDGHIFILALGVLVSVPIMIFGSKIILHFMKRFPWISYLGSGIIAWAGSEIMMKDPAFMKLIHIDEESPVIIGTSAVCVLLVLGLAFLKNKKAVNSTASGPLAAIHPADFQKKDM